MKPINLSPTQINSFNTCQRMWYYAYRKQWRTVSSPALDFGSAWHSACDTIWNLASNPSAWEEWDHPGEGAKFHAKKAFDATWFDLQPSPPEKEWRCPEIAHAMVDNYVDAKWDNITKLELIATEESFSVPSGFEGLNLSGRTDKIYRKDGKVYVVDHKTCSQVSVLHGIQPAWWDSFHLNPQVDIYLLAMQRRFGPANVGGLVVDAALVHKKRHDVFQTKVIRRNEHELNTYLAEFEAIADGMARADIAGVYPRNYNACDKWGGCKYQPLCVQCPDVKSLPANPPAYAPGVKVELGTTEQRLGLASGDKA